MAADNKAKESYANGWEGRETPTVLKEKPRDYPISTSQEPLVGWLEKLDSEDWPEELWINGEIYKRIRRHA